MDSHALVSAWLSVGLLQSSPLSNSSCWDSDSHLRQDPQESQRELDNSECSLPLSLGFALGGREAGLYRQREGPPPPSLHLHHHLFDFQHSLSRRDLTSTILGSGAEIEAITRQHPADDGASPFSGFAPASQAMFDRAGDLQGGPGALFDLSSSQQQPLPSLVNLPANSYASGSRQAPSIPGGPRSPENESYSNAIGTVPKKRSHPGSTSQTPQLGSNISTAVSDVRVKRRQLLRLNPSSHYATGPSLGPDFRPPQVNRFLDRFWTANFEAECIPWTTEIEHLIQQRYSLREFPLYNRMTDIPPADHLRALELVGWAIEVHEHLSACSTKVKDEASWYEYVRLFFSIIPTPGSRIPSLPSCAGQSRNELLITVDATTKSTTKSILPGYPTIKLDFLLCFNPEHEQLHELSELIVDRNITCNVFSDPAIAEFIIPFGIEVKSCNGEGDATAEYQISVWAAKTLELSRLLAGGRPGETNADIAVAVSVRAHVWSLYVSFWDVAGDVAGKRKVVTYGPVYVGGTDSLYGLFKVIKFVGELQRWAAEEVLEDWRSRIMTTVERLETLVVDSRSLQ